MAVQLVDDDTEEFGGVTFAEYVMACFDVIQGDEADWSEEWDEVLQARSAMEFVRDALPPRRAALLTQADAFWKAHPEAFNRFSRYHHARKDLKTALAGWVVDADGKTPEIPQNHWWWRPVETAT